MDSFFALNGITSDSRKVAILRAQLRRVAIVFFDNALKELDINSQNLTYTDATSILQGHFVSEQIIECYQSAFEEMAQTEGESPSEFLSRLYEAADLANISDEKFIYSRFRAGLVNPIKVFCKEKSATSFKDWMKHANAWWNAHSEKTIHLVDNPFAATRYSYFNGDKGKNLNLIKKIGENTLISKNTTINPNPTPVAEAYANVKFPSIASITARMEALELHSLIPSVDNNGQVDASIIREKTVKSLISDKEFRSFIKNIIQETHDEKVNTGKPY